jgi:hypothetical protein
MICNSASWTTDKVCWAQNTTTNMMNMSEPVCDECTVAANAARLGGGLACGETC